MVPDDATTPKAARQPNSFVYRLFPMTRATSPRAANCRRCRFPSTDSRSSFTPPIPSATCSPTKQLKLHTPGTHYPVRWVTVHDTAVDGTDSFNANAAAKAPAPRRSSVPENAQFLPGSGFRTFFFVPPATPTPIRQSSGAGRARRLGLHLPRRPRLQAVKRGISICVLGDADSHSPLTT